MKKAVMSFYMYLMLVVIMGILLIIIVGSKLSPLESPGGRSQELAMITAMHIDALSTVEEGTFVLGAGDKKYDVEVQKWDGFWRGIGSEITSHVKKKGHYVVVTPYDKEGKKLKDSKVFIINSYKLDKDYNITKLSNVSSICIDKKAEDSVARMVKCG